MTEPVASPAEQGTRPPGRPRSARADRAILDATVDLFVEQGYQGMSIEAVAARAGVGKTTIYRRWPSKEDLVVDAIEELIFDVQPKDTGSLRDDLVDLLVQLQTVLTSTRAGEVFPRMLPEVAAASPLGRAWLEKVIQPRFAMLGSMLRRAVDRGELPDGVDLEVARGMLVGPLIFWKLMRRLPRKGARERAERIVDGLLGGLRASRSS
jgi:AcrR family transcriptional regulator